MFFGNFRGYFYWLFQAVRGRRLAGHTREIRCKAQNSERNYGGNCLWLCNYTSITEVSKVTLISSVSGMVLGHPFTGER